MMGSVESNVVVGEKHMSGSISEEINSLRKPEEIEYQKVIDYKRIKQDLLKIM